MSAEPVAVRIRRFLMTSAVVISQLTLLAQHAAPTASELEAAYLYQFGHYVSWPTTADYIGICIVGDAAVATALENLARDDAGADSVVVRRDPPAADRDTCRILFVGTEASSSADIVTSVSGMPILLVGSGTAFLRGGGTIAFVPEGQRIRFSVNLMAAGAAHLRVSSQLLKLALNVIR